MNLVIFSFLYKQCSQTKPILKDWEMNALIAAFLSPLREDLNQIRAIALPRIDARAVHVAAIFMKGLVNFYFLIAACDFPVDRKYVSSSCGCTFLTCWKLYETTLTWMFLLGRIHIFPGNWYFRLTNMNLANLC